MGSIADRVKSVRASGAQKAQTDLGAIATGASTAGISQLEASQLAEAQRVAQATTAVQAAQGLSQEGASGKRHLLQVSFPPPSFRCTRS